MQVANENEQLNNTGSKTEQILKEVRFRAKKIIVRGAKYRSS